MYKILFVSVVLGASVAITSGFGIKDLLYTVLAGVNYGHYPDQYPAYPGGPGHYPGGSGHYPSGPGLYPNGPGSGGYYPSGGHQPVPPGPPGAHLGCPLCDSSVYSYCYHKEAHDACCCGDNTYGYGCRKNDCRTLYAKSCQEYHLISSCCCVDVQKNAIASPILAPVA